MSTFNSVNGHKKEKKNPPKINCGSNFYLPALDDIITLLSISVQSDTSPLQHGKPSSPHSSPHRSPWGGFHHPAPNNTLPIMPLFNPIPPGIDTRGSERGWGEESVCVYVCHSVCVCHSVWVFVCRWPAVLWFLVDGCSCLGSFVLIKAMGLWGKFMDTMERRYTHRDT